MRSILAIAIILLLAACGSDSEVPADLEDASTLEDASGVGDMPPDDAGGETDMFVDRDMTGSDLGNDTGAEADMALDLATPDASVDMSTSDSGSEDTGSGVACASGYTETMGVPGEVAACAAAAEALNQCDASSACAAGWHLCTASEYRARYESAEAPAVLDSSLWLAGCVRDGGAPMSPMDSVCNDCTGTQTGSEEDVGFSCVNSIRLTSESLHVGVRAAASCQFVGTTDTGNDAFWSAQPSSSTQNGALCCVD